MPQPRDPSEGYTLDEAVIAQMYERAVVLPSDCLHWLFSAYFFPSTPSLHALATRNLTTRFAGILMDAPV